MKVEFIKSKVDRQACAVCGEITGFKFRLSDDTKLWVFPYVWICWKCGESFTTDYELFNSLGGIGHHRRVDLQKEELEKLCPTTLTGKLLKLAIAIKVMIRTFKKSYRQIWENMNEQG